MSYGQKRLKNLAFCAVAPPLGRFADSLYLSSEQDYYLLTEFQLSSPYGLGCPMRYYGGIISNNNNIKNPNKYNRVSQHYVLEPLNIAASSNYRGSSLKGVTF